MRNLPNIEKSGFRPGEYVGYHDGVWRIVKVSNVWRAIHQNGEYWTVESRTLELISKLLPAAKKA